MHQLTLLDARDEFRYAVSVDQRDEDTSLTARAADAADSGGSSSRSDRRYAATSRSSTRSTDTPADSRWAA